MWTPLEIETHTRDLDRQIDAIVHAERVNTMTHPKGGAKSGWFNASRIAQFIRKVFVSNYRAKHAVIAQHTPHASGS